MTTSQMLKTSPGQGNVQQWHRPRARSAGRNAAGIQHTVAPPQGPAVAPTTCTIRWAKHRWDPAHSSTTNIYTYKYTNIHMSKKSPKNLKGAEEHSNIEIDKYTYKYFIQMSVRSLGGGMTTSQMLRTSPGQGNVQQWHRPHARSAGRNAAGIQHTVAPPQGPAVAPTTCTIRWAKHRWDPAHSSTTNIYTYKYTNIHMSKKSPKNLKGAEEHSNI